MQVRAENGKVIITVPHTEVDAASGYPYESTRSISLTPEVATDLWAGLSRAANQAKEQREQIITDRRAQLERELAELG